MNVLQQHHQNLDGHLYRLICLLNLFLSAAAFRLYGYNTQYPYLKL
jgi:hypothetical protein